jgi:hypothetical protein
MADRSLSRRQLLQAGAGAAIGFVLSGPALALRQTPKSTLRIRFEELPDLYCYLRWASSNSDKVGAAWKPAVADMVKAAEMLKGRFAFAAIDGLIADSTSLETLAELAPGMPENGPGGLPLRAPLSLVVGAMKAATPLYKSEILPVHLKQFAERQKLLKSEFLPKEREALDYLMKALNLPDKGKEVPVLIVGEAEAPAGFTVRSRKSGAACFVGMTDHPGTQMYETILHEATHALDVAAGNQSGSVLEQLRLKLAKNKVTADDPLMRNVPHTLFFVQAGETVRRVIDPKHKDYGDITGLYKRMAATTDPVIKHWHKHLAGKCSADEAVDRIVTDVLKTS